jgi:type IX secretion system substrate protein
LVVFDGPSTSSPILATLHGNITVPVTYTSANGSLTLRFRSNASVTGAGWEGTFRCYQPQVYRSKNSGNISDVATWEVKEGSNFVNASRMPTASDDSIIIRTGHTITINIPVILDQVLVQQGAILIVANQLTVNNGAGTDILFADGTGGRFINGVSGKYELWPDPATDILNLKAEQSITSVQCFDKNGKLVFDEKPLSNQLKIKVDTWAPGIYQLKLIIDGEIILSKFTKE